ncbi:MAG: glycosyltransferase [Marinifilaceae bacterium]|nr:glycosyltransferase [Marinifilaceae bacterium]
MSTGDSKLLIVVPCYNEQEVLPECVKQLTEVLVTLERTGRISSGRVLLVDDGSKDKTWSMIREYGNSMPQRVCGLKLAHNVGHQNALWAGMEWAATRCDMIISIDADLQDDVNAMIEMVDKYNNGADIVYGVRRERETDTFFKRFTAQSFYKFIKIMGADIVYNHADFRLVSSRALQSFILMPERNLFLRGMVRTLGYNEDSVYYDRKERFAGESKYPLKKMLRFAWDGITSFSNGPLHMIVVGGALFVLVAIAVVIYCIYLWIIGHTVPGWTSLIISIWFVGGVILLAVGVIGEYIGKIYKEVKRRPRYLIQDEIS